MGTRIDGVVTEANATQLRGRTLASDAPTDGQGIVWDAGQSRWEPGTAGGGVSIVSDPMAGTAWTALAASGGASATWGDGMLTLDCVSGATGSCGARAADYLPSGDGVTVAIRLRVVTGDNSNQTRVILSLGQDASNNVNLIFFTDGSIECGFTAGGSYTYWTVASTIAGIDAGVRAGGNLWLRLDRSPLGIAWFWGVGSGGARPTAWHPVFSSIAREVAGYSNVVRDALYACSGADLFVSALTLSAMNLSVDVLAIEAGQPGAF